MGWGFGSGEYGTGVIGYGVGGGLHTGAILYVLASAASVDNHAFLPALAPTASIVGQVPSSWKIATWTSTLP